MLSTGAPAAPAPTATAPAAAATPAADPAAPAAATGAAASALPAAADAGAAAAPPPGGAAALLGAATERLKPMSYMQAVLDHAHGSYAQELEAAASRELLRVVRAQRGGDAPPGAAGGGARASR
jgi:hypothetical protein